MNFTIVHEVPGRIRVSVGGKIPESHACAMEERLLALPAVNTCVAYPKAGSLAVTFNRTEQDRQTVIDELEALDPLTFTKTDSRELLVRTPRFRHLFSQLANMVLAHYARRIMLPVPVKVAWTIWSAIPFMRTALQSLRVGKLDVPVLDAAAIAMGLIQGKPATSSSTMLLLHVGEALEDYTQRRTESGLIRSMLTLPETVRVVRDDSEFEVELSDLKAGDCVVVRTGHQIPIDGTVTKGEAAVNQSSLTGESMPVVRVRGDSVYAGTVVEEGEVFIRISGSPEESKLRSIVTMVEQSEELKSSDQRHIEQMADKLVPWNFLLAGIVAATTRNLQKTSAALMVDYSCALRLSGSIAVMAAQREGAQAGFMVKGSKYFDHMAQADTIVFDKTGTLTQAVPSVREVVAYNNWERDEVLRLAACLEEHFPHPVARAVVNKAFEEGLEHRERHAEVEYVVAHGIVSTLEGARVLIGSEHFVIEDEGVSISEEELDVIHSRSEGSSPLFLAVDGVLRGVIYIDDPLKDGISDVLDELRRLGFKRVVMLTGDNYRSASRIARIAGVDDFQADMLPEDKCRVIDELQEAGHKVVMVGDGVNDSPALSRAYVSVAMGAGSAIAREAADIALVTDDLHSLIELRRLSVALEKRMKHGYSFTVAFNSLLLALGISGVITPQISSVLHNSATIGISASNTRHYLPKSSSIARD